MGTEERDPWADLRGAYINLALRLARVEQDLKWVKRLMTPNFVISITVLVTLLVLVIG